MRRPTCGWKAGRAWRSGCSGRCRTRCRSCRGARRRSTARLKGTGRPPLWPLNRLQHVRATDRAPRSSCLPTTGLPPHHRIERFALKWPCSAGDAGGKNAHVSEARLRPGETWEERGLVDGKLSVLEELEVYKAMNTGPVEMSRSWLKNRRTVNKNGASSQEEGSSALPPYCAGRSGEGRPLTEKR